MDRLIDGERLMDGWMDGEWQGPAIVHPLTGAQDPIEMRSQRATQGPSGPMDDGLIDSRKRKNSPTD